MPFLNFLTQGQPLATSSSTLTTSQVPQYLSDYLYNLMSGAYSAAQEGFELYKGPRVSGLTPEQFSAFDMSRQASTSYQPQLSAAEQTAQQAARLSPTNAARPYFDTAAYMGASQYAQPSLSAAGSLNAVSAANPYMQSAGATNIQGAAQPYMDAANASTPSQIGSYMNPYIENVTNRMGDIASRQIREKLMPAMDDQFIRAGQFGSTRQQELAQRGVRDISENLTDQIGTTLAQGYNVAGQQAQQDLSRRAGLAQTAGQQAQAQGALQANLGQTAGNLTGQQMQNLTSIGQASGNLAGQDLQRMASMGQAAGQLAGTEMTGLGALSGVQSGLAQREQALGLQGAAALEATGAQQQQQIQRNLDVAYNDFQRETQFPREQISYLSNIVRGLPAGGGSTSGSTVGSGQSYSASPLAQLASAGTSAAALSALMGRA
jgi:hypothetical protein